VDEAIFDVIHLASVGLPRGAKADTQLVGTCPENTKEPQPSEFGSPAQDLGPTSDINRLMMVMNNMFCITKSSSFYPYPTKWGRCNMFSSCCDKDSAIVFTTGRLPDVNRP
jgi:hypothetical protein